MEWTVFRSNSVCSLFEIPVQIVFYLSLVNSQKGEFLDPNFHTDEDWNPGLDDLKQEMVEYFDKFEDIDEYVRLIWTEGCIGESITEILNMGTALHPEPLLLSQK